MIGQCTLSAATLRSFTKPDHLFLKDILRLWHYRGDLTETGARKLRAEIGEEAFEHYHWDTAVCTGGILLVIPRYKHPEAVEGPMGGIGLPVEYYWCMAQMETGDDVGTASAPMISRVVPESQERLAVLPGLEWMEIRQVHYYEDGRGPAKRKAKRAPAGVMFFRFHGGCGCVAIPDAKAGAAA